MVGKSTGKKSRLSGRRGAGEDRSAKRQKSYSIKQFLQPTGPPPPPAQAGAGARADGNILRDSSESPEDQQLPSQTPAVGLLPATALPTGPQSTAPTVGGAKLQTALLRSLQHRFATQQGLETPAGLATADGGNQQQQLELAGNASLHQQPADVHHVLEEEEIEEGEEDDGFHIFSQLTYEPTFLSQRPAELESEAAASLAAASTADTSQQPTQTQLGLCSQHSAQVPPQDAAEAQHAEEGLDWPSSQLLSQHQQQQEDALRRASGMSAASHKSTPALNSSERVQCDVAGPSGQKMFPLFRRRDNLKKLYIVRHGESEYNAAMQARGSSWADPLIFDAQLTKRGKQQALDLRCELEKLNLPPDTLWLTSPLQRAMQTLLLACPHAHLLSKSAKDGSSSSNGGDSFENSSLAPNGGSMQPPKVIVLQSITEKVVTSGDIGHPASQLRELYPQLDSQLAAVPEVWWHSLPNKPNCSLQQCFGSHESREHVMSRIGAFRRWLQERPETVIVAVGHSSYWRTFEEVCRGTKPYHMRNCEWRLIHF